MGDIMRAKDFWLSNSYKNQSRLVEALWDHNIVSGPPPLKVLEWHNVNDWLAGELKKKGEIILEYQGEIWWGRKTTGQAVYIDGVILEIYDEWKENRGS